MRDLRTIRIFLTVLFLTASLAYLFIGSGVTPLAAAAPRVQIIPSSLATTIGATGIWLVATFIFGRIYCSSVCPIGAIQDSATWLRRKLGRRVRRSNTLRSIRIGKMRRHIFAPFAYHKAGKFRGIILLIYIGLLLIGIISAATLIEPWNMLRSAARLTNPEADAPWLLLAVNASTGALISLFVIIMIWGWTLLAGRGFCTEICPIGTALGAVAERSVYRIEIDPDRCTNCMRCEEHCKVGGISVITRTVDNARCVRCFDCLKVCADDAINFQRGRNRRSDPMMKKSIGN